MNWSFESGLRCVPSHHGDGHPRISAEEILNSP